MPSTRDATNTIDSHSLWSTWPLPQHAFAVTTKPTTHFGGVRRARGRRRSKRPPSHGAPHRSFGPPTPTRPEKMPKIIECTSTMATTHHEEEEDDALPPTVAAVVEPAKLKLLEARFGADPDNSNSQKSFDSPSLQYRLPHPSSDTTVPSWQRMQTPTAAPPNKSSLKNNARKQAHPQQRKSVVIVVQESPPTTKSKGGNSNGSSSVRIYYVDLSKTEKNEL
jgi:hypothetical protein